MNNTVIKKTIAFIILCVLLVVLDKVYSLKPTALATKTSLQK